MPRITLTDELRQSSKTVPSRDWLPRLDLAVNRAVCADLSPDSSGFSLMNFGDSRRGRTNHGTLWRFHVPHN